MKPPIAPRGPHTDLRHGALRADPYAWLRTSRWQAVMRDPYALEAGIRAYLAEENQYTEACMQGTLELQRRLVAELRARIKEDEDPVPVRDGPWEYYCRYEVGAQHPRYFRKPSGRAVPEQLLLDGEALAAGHAYFSLGSVEHTTDHRRLGYAFDPRGSETYALAFIDLEQCLPLEDSIPETAGKFVFTADGQQLLYTLLDAQHRPYRAVLHRLGTPSDQDVLVYEEHDPGFFVTLDLTEDRQYIVITAHDHATTELRLLDARTPRAPPRVIFTRQTGHEYAISLVGDELLILTNHGGAEDFKLVRAPVNDPSIEHWQELVPHRPGVFILGVLGFSQHVVRLERESGLARIVVRRRSTGEEHAVAFEEPNYRLELVPGYEYDTPLLRFIYSSLTTPEQVYAYEMDTRQRTLLKQREMPSGYAPERYRSARVFAESHDGARVPISLLWHEATPLDASAPLLLYGYGAYGITIPASFVSHRASLVNRGFIYAIAHVRGGKDLGYAWYRKGKLLDKQNSVLDFIAAADHLCAARYTSPGNLSIHGASAGGWLVGAALNLRPELFKAAVADVPFVDVLNTLCDPELPLTPIDWPEWGDPLHDPEAYRAIAAHSPYDNVEAKAYPHLLVTAGLSDPRVTYWEPAKWVARLRALKTDDHLLLLNTSMGAGHGGPAGRLQQLEEIAFKYAFLLLVHDRLDAEVLPSV